MPSGRYCRQLRTHSVMLSSLALSVVARRSPFTVRSGGDRLRPSPSLLSLVVWSLTSGCCARPRSLSNCSVSSWHCLSHDIQA